MKIYLATWLIDQSCGDSLAKTGGKAQLLSFFFLKTQLKELNEQFREYCQTGQLHFSKKRTK